MKCNKKLKLRLWCLMCFTFLAIVLCFEGADAQDKQVVDSIEHVIATATDDSVRIYALVSLSQHYSSYDLLASIYQAEEALRIAQNSTNENLLAFAMFNAGNAYFEQGMFETATGHYYKYLDIQRENDNAPGIAFALSNIGAVKLKMEDFEGGKQSFLSAFSILTELSENDSQYKSYLPSVLNNLGIAYQNEHQYDSALWCYKKGLAVSAEVGVSPYFRASLINNIGGLYLDMNEVDSAFLPLNNAMKLRQEANDLAGQAASYNRLADYYFAKNQPDKGVECLYNGLEIARTIGSTDMRSLITKKLYDYYYMENMVDSALKYSVLYNRNKDSLNNSETLRELTRLELNSQFRHRERIKQLEQERINNIYLFTAISLVLLLSVFVLLFYLSQNKVKRLRLEKKNISLLAQNTSLKNENLRQELEVRNKELTTNVMNMIRKNELIKQIIEKLSAMKIQLGRKNSEAVRNIIVNLNNVQDESIWNEFEIRYQKVHVDFYKKLQKINSSLTTNERRLCAFLRLNMTTKDIAAITGQSVRSIEVARTRLRKKLDLTNSDKSLVEFLTSL